MKFSCRLAQNSFLLVPVVHYDCTLPHQEGLTDFTEKAFKLYYSYPGTKGGLTVSKRFRFSSAWNS